VFQAMNCLATFIQSLRDRILTKRLDRVCGNLPRMKTLCVFCGSNFGADPAYRASAIKVGSLLAARGITLVYGGGKVGMMGALADSCLSAGGRVLGIIPKSLAAKEIAHQSLTELRVVDSMHERKKLMGDQSDAFLALPGGFGRSMGVTRASSHARAQPANRIAGCHPLAHHGLAGEARSTDQASPLHGGGCSTRSTSAVSMYSVISRNCPSCIRMTMQ
jgi:Possible lysine decarboxylase